MYYKILIISGSLFLSCFLIGFSSEFLFKKFAEKYRSYFQTVTMVFFIIFTITFLIRWQSNVYAIFF